MKLRHKFILFSLLVILGPIVGLGLATAHLINRARLRSVPETLEHELDMAWLEYWSHGEQVKSLLAASRRKPTRFERALCIQPGD